MKVKVASLYKKLELIERDIIELKNTRSRISTERDYSNFLNESFDLEISKLESQKKEILSLKIVGAPSDLHKTKNQMDEANNLYNMQEKELSTRTITIETLSTDKKNETKKQTHRY